MFRRAGPASHHRKARLIQMLNRALCNDLRHGLGGLILCQLPAACKAKRKHCGDVARIGGGELFVRVRHPPT